MSNRQLEDILEEASERQLASTLGLSIEELSQLDYEISTKESDDGLVYGYTIHFQEYSPPEILKKVEGLSPSNHIFLQPHEMESDPYHEELLWDITSSTQFDNLLENLNSAKRLLATEVFDDSKFHLLVMLHAHIISALEYYLSSTFIHTVTNSKTLIRQFIETDAHFVERKLSFSELYGTHENIETIVAQNLAGKVFHKMKDTQKMYKSILNVEFGEIQWLMDAVATRHDCAHRAGHTCLGSA